MADALAAIPEGAMSSRAHPRGGQAGNRGGGGLTHLQYDDDTLILILNYMVDIINLKFLLMCFKSMSGLKINFEESEAVVTSCDLEAGSAQIGAHD